MRICRELIGLKGSQHDAMRMLKTLPKLEDATILMYLMLLDIDYATNIWSHACGSSAMAALNRVQRTGAQAITWVFRTVATVIREAEANIATVRERHQGKAAAFWVNLCTLPPTNPLARLHTGR
jgi:hypothetical protein